MNKALISLIVILAATGCSSVRDPIVVEPYEPIEIPASSTGEANGSIYQASVGFMPLFEDQRPRRVGDIITIILEEQANATKSSSANTVRSANVTVDLEGLPDALEEIAKYGFSVGSGNEFNGGGGASASNQFTGIVTVQVTQVLPNGNLRVRGEKQIAINQGTEFIRFSGIVSPRTISGRNTVVSTAVAEARLEYIGDGYITGAQRMGWLQRFFNYITPL